jgi:hypothetical protein
MLPVGVKRTGGRVEELGFGRFTSGDEYLAVLQQRRGLPRCGATMLPVDVNVPAVGSKSSAIKSPPPAIRTLP